MNEIQIQTVLSHLSEELHRFIDTIGKIPYVALPSERPEIICFSGKIKELTGYDVNEILADKEHWENIIHPYDREQVFAAFARCKSEGTPFNIEYRIVHRDGSLRFVSDKGEPVFNNKGQISQIEGLITPTGESGEPENIPLLEIKELTSSNNVNSNYFQKV
ncbi:MAG: PAS domain-containing protein [Sedimentisphaerales bacterium]